ncbi:hypothetical protein Hbl1158_05455 [Halobaculum sp. CBA1158]|uniref:RPA family protein n=1 Tax=Halobaculum sp. CBA1158 TaxID=2904243 RepID=UPI001F1ECD53|nr:hypothetical protein [Halobaculum sp. CBA1158]UIP00804.1 hypothetical protein Hbl1158_05455 [Halobaculum sp. CBA1158]
MSSSDANGDDGSDDSGPGTREVAHRVFAAEFDDADLDHSESDEERAPNYVVTPTGLRVNRLFAVGVLTEVESVNEQTLRGRVVDPTGAFVTYAGQYQPDEAAFLDRTTPPEFVALTGKARTFEPDDADVVYTSVRPESLATVDADTRDRWVVSAAEATLRRIAVFAAALEADERGDDLRVRLENAGVPTALAAGIPLAIDHYGTGARYLEAVRTLAVDALEVVADEREEVGDLTADPADTGAVELGPLPEVPYDLEAASSPDIAAGDASDVTDADVDTDADADADAADTDAADTDAAAEPAEAAGLDTDADAEADSGVDATPESPESADATETESASEDPTEELDDFDAGDGGVAGDADDDGVGGGPDDALGDFEAGDDDPLEDFDAGDTDPEDIENAITEEERREVEEEHGVEFSTGSEVPGPGEVDIETPDPDATDAGDDRDPGDPDAEPETGGAGTEPTTGADFEPDAAGEVDDSAVDESIDEQTGDAVDDDADDAVDAADGTDDADVDLETAVVDAMATLDDGDGADREAVVAAVVDDHGVDPSDAEDAIQEALMSGKCYEPADGTLKPI